MTFRVTWQRPPTPTEAAQHLRIMLVTRHVQLRNRSRAERYASIPARLYGWTVISIEEHHHG